MFKQGIQYERFCEPELELRRRNNALPVATILAASLSSVVLAYLLS